MSFSFKIAISRGRLNMLREIEPHGYGLLGRKATNQSEPIGACSHRYDWYCDSHQTRNADYAPHWRWLGVEKANDNTPLVNVFGRIHGLVKRTSGEFIVIVAIDKVQSNQ